MTTKRKRLDLHLETLRNLSADEVGQIRGAKGQQPPTESPGPGAPCVLVDFIPPDDDTPTPPEGFPVISPPTNNMDAPSFEKLLTKGQTPKEYRFPTVKVC